MTDDFRVNISIQMGEEITRNNPKKDIGESDAYRQCDIIIPNCKNQKKSCNLDTYLSHCR